MSPSHDMASYAVTTDYLRQSAIRPTQGKIFDSNEIALKETGSVAGLSTEEALLTDDREKPVEFTIDEGSWIKVRDSASRTGRVIGYTRRAEGTQRGVQVMGDKYIEARRQGLGDTAHSPYFQAGFRHQSGRVHRDEQLESTLTVAVKRK